jgi:hypothetical protein
VLVLQRELAVSRTSRRTAAIEVSITAAAVTPGRVDGAHGCFGRYTL